MKKSERLFAALGYEKLADSDYLNEYTKREQGPDEDEYNIVLIKQDGGGMVCMTVNDETGWFRPDEIEAINEMCKEYYRNQEE